MKKIFLSTIAVLALGFVYVGIGFGGGQADDAKMANDLWAQMQAADYRANWKMWPGKEALYEGQKPHGAFLSLYVNDAAYGAVTEKKGAMPEGAVLIKENYMPDKKLAAITVMKKVKGYNPEAGDWFWVKFGPGGEIMTMQMDAHTVQLAGKVMGCIGCHSSQSANDYIFTGSLK